MTYSEIYEKSVDKTSSMCCPSCKSDRQLEYADSEVLICKNCGYSIDAIDLQSEWQDILEVEMGFYE